MERTTQQTNYQNYRGEKKFFLGDFDIFALIIPLFFNSYFSQEDRDLRSVPPFLISLEKKIENHF